jgi:hypothetical protein
MFRTLTYTLHTSTYILQVFNNILEWSKSIVDTRNDLFSPCANILDSYKMFLQSRTTPLHLSNRSLDWLRRFPDTLRNNLQGQKTELDRYKMILKVADLSLDTCKKQAEMRKLGENV